MYICFGILEVLSCKRNIFFSTPSACLLFIDHMLMNNLVFLKKIIHYNMKIALETDNYTPCTVHRKHISYFLLRKMIVKPTS